MRMLEDGVLKEAAKRLASLLAGEYAIYRIYKGGLAPPGLDEGWTVRAASADELAAHPDAVVRAQASYAGEGAHAYACERDGDIAAVCFYWHGERYLPRNFWPLKPGQAKLVQIITRPDHRGQGAARALIAGSQQAMAAHGFSTVFARIWHSNHPSLRAFEHAGWTPVATVVEVNPLRLRKPWRLSWGG